ncbi:MAG TPA: GNAT family protein [Acidimicrobiales bacterium]|nr:GNAT family protein [Acidimicrobiales bacterium]
MSDFVVRPLRSEEAAQVAAWVYEPPHDIYNGDPEHPEDYLAVGGGGYGYYAIATADDDEVVGFCCFGPEARVRGQAPEPETLDVGGGVRPDRVSQRLATKAFPLILQFGHDEFRPRQFRTAVASFNERSLRLCLSAGFREVRRFEGPGREFVELVREGDAQPD